MKTWDGTLDPPASPESLLAASLPEPLPLPEPLLDVPPLLDPLVPAPDDPPDELLEPAWPDPPSAAPSFPPELPPSTESPLRPAPEQATQQAAIIEKPSPPATAFRNR